LPADWRARAARGDTATVMALQRLAGNTATGSLVRSVQRQGAEACCTSCAGGGSCGDEQAPVQRQGIPPFRVPPPRLDPTEIVPGLIFGSGCTPYTSRTVAEAAWHYVIGTYIPFAMGMFGTETAALWLLYLDKASRAMPRPHQTLTSKASIVAGFRTHHKTAEAEEGLVTEVVNAVNSGAVAVTPGVPRRMPLADAIGAGTVFSMLNGGGSQEMNFDQVATTIPGNIAGGVGAGGPPGNTGPDPDTRNAWGDVEILATPGTGGGAGTVSVTPHLNFHVHDTVDFCPGALGGMAARAETIPMSRLERTEATLGPLFAADVPFDVDFPGPGTARTHPFTPPPPPPPPPVVLPTNVLFGFDSSEVTSEGRTTLRGLLPRLRSSPATQVVGHTDDRGSDAYNQGLSDRRARAVVEALVQEDPTLAGRLQPSGRGEREPIDTNATPDGRKRNRRVELVFTP
jgi:outer membrane protein OmpA-like peptidoglycan-associated protein